MPGSASMPKLPAQTLHMGLDVSWSVKTNSRSACDSLWHCWLAHCLLQFTWGTKTCICATAMCASGISFVLYLTWDAAWKTISPICCHQSCQQSYDCSLPQYTVWVRHGTVTKASHVLFACKGACRSCIVSLQASVIEQSLPSLTRLYN